MKVVIFGKAGQLGRELVRVFSDRNHQVAAFNRSEINIGDLEQVEAVVGSNQPDVILNAAAYNAVDRAESEPMAAFKSNALAVGNIAVVCQKANARLVHFSTDYVFDGTAGRPYVEDDSTHPLGAYAVSKLAGEMFAQAYLADPLIIRTSGVFGLAGLGVGRTNFPEVMIKLALSGQPIKVLNDHFPSPTYAPALAERTADLVEHKAAGVFHIGGGQTLSWFEYARMIFDVAQLKPDLKPTDEMQYRTAARRPKFSGLSNLKMESLGIAPMPALQTAVEHYCAERSKLLNHLTQATPA